MERSAKCLAVFTKLRQGRVKLLFYFLPIRTDLNKIGVTLLLNFWLF